MDIFKTSIEIISPLIVLALALSPVVLLAIIYINSRRQLRKERPRLTIFSTPIKLKKTKPKQGLSKKPFKNLPFDWERLLSVVFPEFVVGDLYEMYENNRRLFGLFRANLRFYGNFFSLAIRFSVDFIKGRVVKVFKPAQRR